MAQPKKPLWTEIDGEPWLDNPRRRRRRSKGRKRRRGRARAKLQQNAPRRRRRRHSRNPFGGHMARRRRRSHARHRRRGFRSNPPRFARGWMGKVTEGIKGGVGVVVGKAAARAIPAMVGQPRTGVLGMALQGLVGIIGAPLVARFGGGEFSKAFLWGAFSGPIESLVVGANVPVLSPALSSYADELSAIPATATALGAGPGAGMPGFTIDEEEMALVQ